MLVDFEIMERDAFDCCLQAADNLTKNIRTLMGWLLDCKITLASGLGFLLGIIVLSLTWRCRALSAREPYSALK
jgi:hypothetical protein